MTGNILTYDRITDNTMPGSWMPKYATEDSSIEHPTQTTDEATTTDTNTGGNDTPNEALGAQNVPEEIQRHFFATLSRGLDLTRCHDWKQLGILVLEVLRTVVVKAVWNLPNMYINLVALLIITDWFGSGEARQLLGQLTPLMWVKWNLSNEARAAKEEYTAAYDGLTADYNKQLEQLRLQREARRVAWMG